MVSRRSSTTTCICAITSATWIASAPTARRSIRCRSTATARTANPRVRGRTRSTAISATTSASATRASRKSIRASRAGSASRSRRSSSIYLACLIYDWRAFLALVPFYYFGHSLSSLNGYYEHFKGDPDTPIAWGVSTYNKLYNWTWLYNGFHAEHHYRPKVHWTRMIELARRIRDEQVRRASTSWAGATRSDSSIALRRTYTDGSGTAPRRARSERERRSRIERLPRRGRLIQFVAVAAAIMPPRPAHLQGSA